MDDFDLIVSSFKSSYGVSIYSTDFQSMTWQEFRSLLSGLGPDTPLARTVQIRLEDDKDVLKHFTSAQHRIRNKW
ncbi:MAG: Gp15 family bacteriophage protein, partial [Ruminococcus sp.]